MLQKQALRAGVSILEFWDLTPAETVMTIEAAEWRSEREQRFRLSSSWMNAVLTRAKRIPPLKQLLTGGKAKILHGEELDKRRDEYREMTANLDIGALTRKNGDTAG